jgi:hypothetical protein
MRAVKRRTVIAAADVERVFDAACIDRLAKIARLPENFDKHRFAEGIRTTARLYARDASRPTVGKIRDEIEHLHRAAARRGLEQDEVKRAAAREDVEKAQRHQAAARGAAEQVRGLLATLSAEARSLLTERGSRPSVHLQLPTDEDLSDESKLDTGCEVIRRLCSVGGYYGPGRRRKAGKRSKDSEPKQSLTRHPQLHAPRPQPHPAKLQAESDLVISLQLTLLEATGKMPSLTALHGFPGPLARLVTESLRLLGAARADSTELINEVNRSRREAKKKQPPAK